MKNKIEYAKRIGLIIFFSIMILCTWTREIVSLENKGDIKLWLAVFTCLLELAFYLFFTEYKLFKKNKKSYRWNQAEILYQILVCLYFLVITTFIEYSRIGIMIAYTAAAALGIWLLFTEKKREINKKWQEYKDVFWVEVNLELFVLKFLLHKYYHSEVLYRSSKGIMFLFIFGVCCFGVLICSWFLQEKLFKTEKMFARLAPVFGVLYLLVLPPFTAPDEECHFAMAYSYSNILLGGERQSGEAGLRENGNGCMFYFIPCRKEDELCIKNNYDFEYVWQYPMYNYYINYQDGLLHYVGFQPQFEGRFIGRFTNGSILAYLPAVLGITLSRVLGLGGMQLIFAGRIFNYLFYCICIYWALKKIPFGKVSLLVVTMFPMMTELGMSYSYDAVLISSSYLFIAYILYLITSVAQITKKDIVLLAVMLSFMGSAKVFYVLNFLWLFLIPSEKFGRQQKKWIIFFIGIVGGVSVLISSFVGISGYLSPSEGTEYFTISYIVTHISDVLFLITNSIVVSGDYYLGTLVGQLLGWLDYRMSWLIIVSFCVILISSLVNVPEKKYPEIRIKIMAGGLLLLIIGGIVLTTVMWTPITGTVIEGIQGRYFLEVIPLGIICALKKGNRQRDYNKEGKIMVSCLVLNLLCIISVLNITMTR